MDHQVPVYILKRGSIDDQGHIVSQNVGVTFSIHEAELHKGEGFENDFDTLQTSRDIQDDIALTEVILAMRECVAIVKAEIE